MTVWPLSLQTQGVTVIVSVILEVQEVLVRGNEARQTWRSIFRALVSEMKGARLPGPPLSRLGEQIGRGLTSSLGDQNSSYDWKREITKQERRKYRSSPRIMKSHG
jgi:hypothetical protein